MENELIVVTGASCVAGTMTEYVRQLSKAGIEVCIHDLRNKPWLDRGAHISEQIGVVRHFADKFWNYKYILFSCAHDVTFYGFKESILVRAPKEGILHAAEKNCYPDAALDERIPNRGPWRFANGGLCIGSPESFIRWTLAVERHPLYDPHILDQHFLNIMLAERSDLCQIDWETRLFFCLYGGYEELWFDNGQPVNGAYDTRPVFVHANGRWDTAKAFQNQRMSII